MADAACSPGNRPVLDAARSWRTRTTGQSLPILSSRASDAAHAKAESEVWLYCHWQFSEALGPNPLFGRLPIWCFRGWEWKKCWFPYDPGQTWNCERKPIWRCLCRWRGHPDANVPRQDHRGPGPFPGTQYAEMSFPTHEAISRTLWQVTVRAQTAVLRRGRTQQVSRIHHRHLPPVEV